MKFYSELTRHLYDSEKDLIAAEEKVKEAEAKKLAEEKAKKTARAERAKEVEKAIKDANEAQAKAVKLLREFTRDYGYFHYSYSTDDAEKAVKKSEETRAKAEKFDSSKTTNDFLDLLASFLS